MKKTYVFLLLAIAVLEFMPLAMAPPQPSLDGDGLGHLFKVHELMKIGWKPWIEEWYAGFPLLRFYPPLSYLVAAFLGNLLGSAIRGYAATLMLSAFIGALALHVYLKRLGKEPYVAPVVFLLFPWHLGVAYIEGNFPRANAINLSPLFILGVLLLTEHRERYLFVSALAISLVLLIHHSIIIPLLMLATVLHWEDLMELRVLGNGIRVSGIVVFLTAFWYIPFFYNIKWVNFTKIIKNPWLFEHYSLKPSLLLKPEFLIPLTVTLALWLSARKSEGHSLRELILLMSSIYLSLGVYSPTRWIYSLPLISMIPPYRWLDITNVLVPLIVGDALKYVEGKKKAVTAAVTITLLLFPFSGEVHTVKPVSRDVSKLAEYLADQPGKDWRFLVNNGTAVYSYIPALSGKNTLNGWYHEGNPADREMERLWYLLTNNKNASFYLRAYDVKYLINAKQPGYVRVTTVGAYTIYEANVSFIQPVSTVMIGQFYDLPLNYAYIKSLPENLSAIRTILYVGNPSNETSRKLLQFVRDGGRLVWIPESSGMLFGVNASISAINSSALSSVIYNVSHFAPFKYGNSPWYGPVFKNITPLVNMGNWTLIGVKKIGKGTLYALGGNFLYHILYTGSNYELGILRKIIPRETVQVEGLIYREGMYSFKVITKKPALIRVSEAYFPYWRISVNGREVKALRDDRTGLTLITVESGYSLVRADFKDPFERLRYYSALAWVITILYTALKFRPTKKIPIPSGNERA